MSRQPLLRDATHDMRTEPIPSLPPRCFRECESGDYIRARWRMPSHSGRQYKTSEVIQPGEAHDTIPGLHHDIVVTHVLSCANMGLGDIARLRSVSRALYDAVEATGRVCELEEIQDLYQKFADITYVHATTPRDMHRRYQDLTAIAGAKGLGVLHHLPIFRQFFTTSEISPKFHHFSPKLP
jgi:hypothetical protein